MLRWTAWLPIAFYVGAVVLLTATVPPHAPFGLSDKTVHAAEFFGLALLTVRGFSLQFESPPRLPVAIATLMLGIAVGSADELAQSFAPLRTSDFADLSADALGSVFGALVGVLFFLRT
ncbi:MAG: VanZ family protein, partial [Bradymonadia bacterium]